MPRATAPPASREPPAPREAAASAPGNQKFPGEKPEEQPAEPLKPGSPPENPGDLPIPDVGKPQADLVLRKLKDILNSGQDTKPLEDATGMSRQEIEQFVKKFEAPEREPAGEGRDLQGDQHENKTMTPRKVGDGLRNRVISTQGQRGPGSVSQDDFNNQTQGLRSQVPPELRSGVEAYQNSLSRMKSPASTPSGGQR